MKAHIHISTLITCVLLFSCNPFKRSSCKKPAPTNALEGSYSVNPAKSRGIDWIGEAKSLTFKSISKRELNVELNDSIHPPRILSIKGRFRKQEFVFRHFQIHYYDLILFVFDSHRYKIRTADGGNLLLLRESDYTGCILIFPFIGKKASYSANISRIHN